MAPLVAYGAQLAERTGRRSPRSIRWTAESNARLLILLETPGPRVLGTGFVSRDNPSGTAANMFRFLTNAGIARSDTVIWNIVPWLIQTPGERNRNPSRGEVAEGLAICRASWTCCHGWNWPWWPAARRRRPWVCWKPARSPA